MSGHVARRKKRDAVGHRPVTAAEVDRRVQAEAAQVAVVADLAAAVVLVVAGPVVVADLAAVAVVPAVVAGAADSCCSG